MQDFEAGGMYKIKQARAPCTQSHHGFIKCTFIIAYYDDDDMTECTDEDLRYLNSVDGFIFSFFNCYWEAALGH